MPSLPPMTPATPPALSVEVPEDIDSSGGSDVSAELQAFIDGVPDTRTIVFPTDATYRVDTGLHLDDRHGLYLEGNGTTLLASGCDWTDSNFVIGLDEPSSDITIRGFTLYGENDVGGTSSAYSADCPNQHGVAVFGSSDIELADLAITDVRGDCLYVAEHGANEAWSDGVWFRDSTCDRNGRMGVAIVAGRDVRVERVAFDEISIIVFDIEPNDGFGGATDVIFADNHVGSYAHDGTVGGVFFGAVGSLDAPVRRVIVQGNTVREGTLSTLVGSDWSGDGDYPREDFVFVANVSDQEATGPVLDFRSTDGITIFGNEQPLDSGELAIFTDSVNVAYWP